jgi:GAF domain-containing protein
MAGDLKPGSGIDSRAGSPAQDGLLERLSRAFLESPAGLIGAFLATAVREVTEFLDADHGMLAQPISEAGPLGISHRWSRAGRAPLEPFEPEAALPWITAPRPAGTILRVESPDDLPAEAPRDRAFMERAGIRSILSAPLVAAGAPVGWLAVAVLRDRRSWPPPLVDQLRSVAGIVASALALEQAEQTLRHVTEFDRALGDLAARLIRAPADDIDAEITRALGTVGELFGADRASVVQLIPAQHMVTRSHMWLRTGTSRPQQSVGEDELPWLLARAVGAREIVLVTRLDDLPPEATRDRATLEKFGVVSGAIAPMEVEGRVIGMLALSTLLHEQRWQPARVAHLRLVGEILASALARRDAHLAMCATLAENERLRELLEAEKMCTSRHSSTRFRTSARSSVGAEPSGRRWNRFARSPTRTCRSCSSARPASARSSSRAASMRRADGATDLSSR